MLLSRAPFPQADIDGAPRLHDTNVYKYNIACQVLCYVLVGTSVLARIYMRIFIKREFKAEDYTCIVAWALSYTLSGLALACIQFGGGSHLGNVPSSDVASFLRIQYLGELAYYPAAFFTKTSILFLIARIFAPHRKVVLLARIIIGLMLLYYLPAFFIKVFRCIPIHKTWDIKAQGKCITTEPAIFLADCIVSLVTDLAILIMPMPLVWKLQAPRRRKLRIMAVFAGGILACAAIIARTVENYRLDDSDATYSVQIIMLWAIVEVNLGIICSCLPILPSFYQHISQRKRASVPNTSTYYQLNGLTSGASGAERANISHAGKVQVEAAVEASARKEDSRAGHAAEGFSISVLGGANGLEERGRFWDGEGILKTVDVEQTGVSVPESAALPTEHIGVAFPMEQSHGV